MAKANKPHELPSYEELSEALDYDPSTGSLKWKINIRRRPVGGMAGSEINPESKRRYVSIQYRGKTMLAHRIAWLLHTGEWPDGYVDHINGNTCDNRIENLRTVTCTQSSINRSRKCTNFSGEKGVAFCKQTGKWRAQIALDRKSKFLGRFPTKEEAMAAYRGAACILHGDFSRLEKQSED